MARMRVPISKGFFKRAGWLMLVILFLVTGLGVGLVSFWQNTHQKNTDTQPNQVACQIASVPGGETLPVPDAFKADGPVSTVQVTDLAAGSGEKVKTGDCLEVKYYGTLASSGQMFDENFSKPETLKFQVGVGQVIPGWDQGLIGMQVGGTRRLVIPAALAYGSQATGQIPANSDLVFVVKLERIVKQ